MSRNKMGYKQFALKVKDLSSDDEPGTIEGYASVYNVRDSYNEVVVAGAFGESLARQQREGTYPLMLWQHDRYEPIGVWDDLVDDGTGLRAKGRLLINQSVPTADKVHSLLRAKAVRGISIGYYEVDKEPGTNGEPTKLVKLDLFECSIVSFPANRRARVTGVKSLDDASQWERLEELARRFRDGDPASIKEFEEVLREAGFPKSAAQQIASVGYAKSIRSESDGMEAMDPVLERLKKAAGRF